MESFRVPVPFDRAQQLCHDLDESDTATQALPEYPRICLSNPKRLDQFLHEQLWAADLEKIAHHLWLLSTSSSANISPLHEQRARGRSIILTEDPRLHLVRLHDRVLVKPLHRYLLSHTFWQMYLSAKDQRTRRLRQSALGFLRTYVYLVRHPSDFAIASSGDLQLVPSGISRDEFDLFLDEIASISDEEVSGRYQYGELRLNRLNLYAPLLFGKFYYQQIHWHYSDYFSRLYAPLLFAFAIASTLLNAMQVELATEQLSPSTWHGFWASCRIFSLIVLIVVSLITVATLSIWIWMLMDEWLFALCRRRSAGREKQPSRS